ncbi:MAG TPA: rhodanese-like domain-containing protein [Terriglobales bacterium]|nr:rhodanese-like domain-containing protein [Terriglobales bacterium]
MKILVAILFLLSAIAVAEDSPALTQAQISPQALVRVIQSNQRAKLLVLNVGPRVLYAQSHIPGAEYIGPTNDPRGIEIFRNRVKSVPKTKQIILYCGCCPWEHCPNIRPAFAELKKLGFRNVKVLMIANNFGADWADKDYPVERGQ